MSVEIIGEPTGEVDEKRLYLPGLVVQVTCPQCGRVTQQDYGVSHYLNHPDLNRPFHLSLYCSTCDHEWDVRVILRVKLEVVPKT